MVLATRLKITCAILSGLIASSCHSQSNNQTEVFTLGTSKISVTSDDKHCYLVVSNANQYENITTQLSPPCAFVIKKDGDLLTHAYPKKSLDAVAIIVGDPISNQTRDEWGIDDNIFCGGKQQAVFLKGDEIFLSKSTAEGGVSCPTKGLDEKAFYAFSHPPVDQL